MNKYNIGFPKIKWNGWIPRILIPERLEKRTKWVTRLFTLFCIILSAVSLPWYIAVIFAIICAVINFFVENVLFYYVNSISYSELLVRYDSDKWVGNYYTCYDPSKKSQIHDEIGLVFNDAIYARELFNLLNRWTGSDSDLASELKVSFVIDEDLYFVYIYPDHDSEKVDDRIQQLIDKDPQKKYTKEGFTEINHLTICKSFPTGNFGLGTFMDNHPENLECKVVAYLSLNDEVPHRLESIKPIVIKGYKARIPSQLTRNEYEWAHWNHFVQPHRKAIDADA